MERIIVERLGALLFGLSLWFHSLRCVRTSLDVSRRGSFSDHLRRDHHTTDILLTRYLIHHAKEDLLHDGTKSTCASATLDCLIGDYLEGSRFDLKFHIIHLKEMAILLDQRVLRFGQYLQERCSIEVSRVAILTPPRFRWASRE